MLTKALTRGCPRLENERFVWNSVRILPPKTRLHIFRNHDNGQRTYFNHKLQILSCCFVPGKQIVRHISKRKQSAARRVKPKNIPLAEITIGNLQEDPGLYRVDEIRKKNFQLPTEVGDRFHFN